MPILYDPEAHCCVGTCRLPVRACGMCGAHYRRLKSGKPMSDPVKNCRRGTCVATDCERPSITKSLCRLHYKRSLVGKPLEDPVPIVLPATCTLPGCSIPYRSGGFCAKHAMMDKNLRKAYGIGVQEYYTMLETQSGCCAICGIAATSLTRRLAVDHNHVTGKVRGLLCCHCNPLLGQAKESVDVLKKACEYILLHSKESIGVASKHQIPAAVGDQISNGL